MTTSTWPLAQRTYVESGFSRTIVSGPSTSSGPPRARPRGGFSRTVAIALILAALIVSARAQDMPDPKSMSGTPLPVSDLTPGTVVVRVVKGTMVNVVPNVPVVLQVAGTPRTVNTNTTGHAEFSGLPIGATVKASATIAGERLDSQEFPVPSAGGVRLVLVATDPELEKKAAEDRKLAEGPAQPGAVVLGDQSRLVFELGDEGLTVFNIFPIVNTARVRVQPPAPVVFELPDHAAGASALEGSSQQVTVAGKRVTVNGPFAPGTTLVQFAYTLPYSGGELTYEQKMPAPLDHVAVMSQKVGEMHLTSPQFSEHQDMTSEGQTFLVGRGPGLKAGDVLTLNFTGLPHHATWPRNVALALASVILAGGIWGGVRSNRAIAGEATRRKKLAATRERLFAELATVEEQHRGGTIDPQRYTERRRELVTALERVYAEMDEEAAA